MPENPLQQQFIGTILLQAINDGSGALATFNLLGVFTVQISIPAADVENFIRAYVKVKKNNLDIQRMVQKVSKAQND